MTYLMERKIVGVIQKRHVLLCLIETSKPSALMRKHALVRFRKCEIERNPCVEYREHVKQEEYNTSINIGVLP